MSSPCPRPSDLVRLLDGEATEDFDVQFSDLFTQSVAVDPQKLGRFDLIATGGTAEGAVKLLIHRGMIGVRQRLGIAVAVEGNA